MKRIDHLSEAQKARFPEWVDKWKKIGLSTEPADFDRAYKAVQDVYVLLCKLKPPMLVLRMGSPLGAVWGGYFGQSLLKTIAELGSQVSSQVGEQVGSQVRSQVSSQVGSQVESQVWSQVGSQVENQVWSQVGSQVWSQVESQVWSQVRSQVGSQVWSQVRSQVGSQVGSQVRSQVGSQVESQVWSQVRSQVRSQVSSQVESQVESQVGSQVWSQVESQVGGQVESQVWSQVRSEILNNYRGGQFWASWCAYVSFLRDVLGWENETLRAFAIDERLTRSCGFVWWHENVVAISDRPAVLNLDASERLHCENAPSISYRDGWSLYHWHGIPVSKEIIEHPEIITVYKINNEENLEVKRVMLERYGIERFINDATLKEIQSDRFGRLFKLPDAQFPIVLVKNSTPEPDGSFKNYVLTATRRDVKTAHEAVASTFGLTADQYHPVHES